MMTATVPRQARTVPTFERNGHCVANDAASGVANGVEQAVLPCQMAESDLWFGDTPAQLELAKQLCASCPIRAACLQSAINQAEPWGVWGGEIFERGSIIAQKRPRGRPRKTVVAA